MSITYKIAFTGHRPQHFPPGWEFYRDMRINIEAFLASKKAKHPGLEVISGMALGVDQWAADSAHVLGIPVQAYVPFLGQESTWNESQKKEYNRILLKCSSIKVCCSGSYEPWKMQIRNMDMVNDSDELAAVWNGKKEGGTWNCIQYAIEVGKTISFIQIPGVP